MVFNTGEEREKRRLSVLFCSEPCQIIGIERDGL